MFELKKRCAGLILEKDDEEKEKEEKEDKKKEEKKKEEEEKDGEEEVIVLRRKLCARMYSFGMGVNIGNMNRDVSEFLC